MSNTLLCADIHKCKCCCPKWGWETDRFVLLSRGWLIGLFNPLVLSLRFPPSVSRTPTEKLVTEDTECGSRHWPSIIIIIMMTLLLPPVYYNSTGNPSVFFLTSFSSNQSHSISLSLSLSSHILALFRCRPA